MSDARGRLSLVLVAATCLCGCYPRWAAAEEQNLLWPEGAPRARGQSPDDRPELYYFYPEGDARSETAVVVASGGSYGHHGGLHSEGFKTAAWLAKRGILAVVVRYRVGVFDAYNHVDFIADGKRAVRTLRSRATSLGIDPERIGMIGFSAGGHLASALATQCGEDLGDPASGDPIEQEPCRIAFAVLVYPVITSDERYRHDRSWRNLLGGIPSPSSDLIRGLSTETQVTPNTAPTFLVHSRLDRKVHPRNSELFHEALLRAGVPTELWLFDDGGHGVGLARNERRMPEMATWPTRCLTWLQRIGMLTEPR